MKKLLIILFCSFIGFNAYTQTDWKTKLKEDLVTIENGKFITDDTQLLTFQNGATLTLETTAKGDQNTMNRDNFIAIYSNIGVFMMVSILGEAGVSIDDVDFKEVENPEGTADIGIHLNMTDSGIEITITTEEGDEKSTMTWDEFFDGQ